MNKFRNLATALTVAVVVTAGMFASSARVEAAGPSANRGLCQVLQGAYNVATAAGNTDAADSAKNFAASIGCAWAQ